MSNDKDSVLAVAWNEKQPFDAKEIIKDPMYLEFLGLHHEASYYEKDLEQAIITHLHDFLLEMGNGFAFVDLKSIVVSVKSFINFYDLGLICNYNGRTSIK